jgi:lipopolysaccharide export system protein LptA
MSFERKKIKIFVPIGIRILATVFLLGYADVVYSQADTASPVARDTATASIHIVSERMEGNTKERWVEFIGSVVATQKDAVIQADRLKIFYVATNSAPADANAIKKIIADGHVKIVTGMRTATGDHAVYTADDHVLILTGNSKAWSGENIVAGSKITLFLNEDRSIVESDAEEQVEVTFYPKKEGGLLQ